MGRQEEMSEDQLREELVSFARLILLLDRKDALLDRSASVLRLLGDLRRMLFAWEVRVTDRDSPTQARRPGALAPDEPSARIVREALEREEELRRELEGDTMDDDLNGNGA
jgi:hypothetical protein